MLREVARWGAIGTIAGLALAAFRASRPPAAGLRGSPRPLPSPALVGCQAAAMWWAAVAACADGLLAVTGSGRVAPAAAAAARHPLAPDHGAPQRVIAALRRSRAAYAAVARDARRGARRRSTVARRHARRADAALVRALRRGAAA
jgi:hypothetical protein